MKARQIIPLFLTLLLITRIEGQYNNERFDRYVNELRGFILNTTLVALPDGPRKIVGAVREDEPSASCDAKICFVFDGSKQMGRRDFQFQLDLVSIVSTFVALNRRARFSGIQSGLRNGKVSSPKGSALGFLRALQRVRYLRSRRSYLSAGMSFCMQDLNRRGRKPSKMVILGDKRSSFGRLRGPLGPAAIAAKFRSQSSTNKVYVGETRDLLVGLLWE